MAATATPATTALARAGVAHTLHPYHHDPANRNFGDEAAAALGLDPAGVFKTLVCTLHGSRDELVVAVLPVAHRLDTRALAACLGGKKADLADPGVAQRTTGYLVGGISPLGQRKRLRTAVDASARRLGTLFISAGRRGLQVEVAPDDLVRLTGAVVADLCRHG